MVVIPGNGDPSNTVSIPIGDSQTFTPVSDEYGPGIPYNADLQGTRVQYCTASVAQNASVPDPDSAAQGN